MTPLVCLISTGEPTIPDHVRRGYEAAARLQGLPFQWCQTEGVAVLLCSSVADRDTTIARAGRHVAVGNVRLDNRDEVARWTGCGDPGLTDLQLVLRAVALRNTTHIPDLLGDFAFVVWHPLARIGYAACDALGVRRLYYAERRGLLALATRAALLAQGDDYERQYLAELIGTYVPSSDLTVYAGVKALPSGSLAVIGPAGVTKRSYWSAHSCQRLAAPKADEGQLVEECRCLLVESVRLRLGGPGQTWAHLSGGLDSSSIVSVAEWLREKGEAPNGLAGTVTYSDSHGPGADERDYSQTVVDRWNVPNTVILDPPVWYDPDSAVPHLDQPSVALVYYPRERRLERAVLGAGGRILLTGTGGDSLFSGNMFFFADWIAGGRVGPALREMA